MDDAGNLKSPASDPSFLRSPVPAHDANRPADAAQVPTGGGLTAALGVFLGDAEWSDHAKSEMKFVWASLVISAVTVAWFFLFHWITAPYRMLAESRSAHAGWIARLRTSLHRSFGRVDLLERMVKKEERSRLLDVLAAAPEPDQVPGALDDPVRYAEAVAREAVPLGTGALERVLSLHANPDLSLDWPSEEA